MVKPPILALVDDHFLWSKWRIFRKWGGGYPLILPNCLGKEISAMEWGRYLKPFLMVHIDKGWRKEEEELKESPIVQHQKDESTKINVHCFSCNP